MAKTVTLEIDEKTYHLFQKAADGEHRSLDSFLQHAAMHYLGETAYVSDEEMQGILEDADLIAGLRTALHQAEQGKFTIVE
jgi:uncharacterized protein (DUF1778 family)